MSRLARVAPALCVVALAAGYLGVILVRAGGDPLAFARLGTRFSEGDPSGTEGYDGQFNYYIARDPDPQRVAQFLDVPAYRYQHILYPLSARLLALGIPAAIPWTLVGINLACLGGITFLAGELLARLGASRWAALLAGLWAGLIGAVRLDLSEPLALLLVLLALWISGPLLERRIAPAALLLALAMLAKETMAPFVAGWFFWLILRKNYRNAAILSACLLPYALLQIWLWRVFGAPGIGSGGMGATAFEIIPFGGLFRIAEASVPALAAMSLVYLPGLLVPAAFGFIAPADELIRRRATPEGLLLLFNALVIVFAPYSTFREPLGILRLGCGLIVCIWLYAAAKNLSWWKKLGLVGLAYLVFLR